MASRATSYWRKILGRVGEGGGGGSRFASTAAPAMGMVHNRPFIPRPVIKGEFVPVYVVLGMILLSVSLGLSTAELQLVYSPNVFVSKKKRETVPEVEDPDYVVDEADKFYSKSIFRRVAHVQEEFGKDEVGSNPRRGDALKREKRAETLKSVGVDPSKAKS